MQSRFDLSKAAPDAYKAVYALSTYIRKDSGIAHRLVHLINLRASIVNGCAHCVDMHVKEARRDGLPEQWINLVSVWHEAAVYSDAERAVLAWTDALTLVSQTRAPDADYAAIRAHFSEAEIEKLTVAIGVINVWNRLAIASRAVHSIDQSQAA